MLRRRGPRRAPPAAGAGTSARRTRSARHRAPTAPTVLDGVVAAGAAEGGASELRPLCELLRDDGAEAAGAELAGSSPREVEQGTSGGWLRGPRRLGGRRRRRLSRGTLWLRGPGRLCGRALRPRRLRLRGRRGRRFRLGWRGLGRLGWDGFGWADEGWEARRCGCGDACRCGCAGGAADGVACGGSRCSASVRRRARRGHPAQVVRDLDRTRRARLAQPPAMPRSPAA